MSSFPPTALPHGSSEHVSSLVERMDPAIGEATSVMGAVMNELLRRSLRNGVMKIGSELEAFVADKVDATIIDRTPALEQAAAEVADRTARQAAAAEVEVLERWTKETTHELATQMVEAEHRTQTTVATTAEKLTQRIAETDQRAQESTTETARKLSSEIAEVERRSAEATSSAIKELREQSKHAVSRWKELLQEVQTEVKTLTARFQEVQARQEAELARTQQHLLSEKTAREKLAAALESSQSLLSELRAAQSTLVARITELEKPRGLGARIKGLFSRKKETAADTGAELPETP